MSSQTRGTGHLRSGQRDLGTVAYEIHVGTADRPGTTVELESPPDARDGEVLDLTLDDGRVLQCQVRGASPYCRVIGEKPAFERRRMISADDTELSSNLEHSRRRADVRGPYTIHHPCPRCMATEVIVTHRGVMLASLFCVTCRHGWSEPPAAIATATRSDRRAVLRPEAVDRRNRDRLTPPACAYCATDAHVTCVRRTHEELFFACAACDAMWSIPISRPRDATPRPRQ